MEDRTLMNRFIHSDIANPNLGRENFKRINRGDSDFGDDVSDSRYEDELDPSYSRNRA